MTGIARRSRYRRLLPELRARPIIGVWLRHWLWFRRSWRVAATWIFVEPVIVLGAVGFGIGRLVDEVEPGVSYAQFVAPGLIIGNAMFHSLFANSWGAFHRMEGSRMYDTVLSAPVLMRELAAGEIAWATTQAVMTTVAVTAFAAALGLIDSYWAIAIVVAGALTGVMFGAIGLVFAAVAPNTHALTLVFTLFATPLWFFSGAFFPVETLPGAAQAIAWALPMTPAVHLGRGLAGGDLALSHLFATLYLVGLAAIFYPLATWLLRRRLLK